VTLGVDVIAERRLELRVEGRTIEVVAKIARPEPDVPHDAWKCQYEVRFGADSRTTDVHGGDALQALQLSMVTLNGELTHEAKRRGGVLYHLDEPFTSLLEHSGMQIVPIQKLPE
jgi:hypothetical protein